VETPIEIVEAVWLPLFAGDMISSERNSLDEIPKNNDDDDAFEDCSSTDDTDANGILRLAEARGPTVPEVSNIELADKLADML
jgi:hypothetical protein